MYFFVTFDSDNMLKEFDTKGNCMSQGCQIVYNVLVYCNVYRPLTSLTYMNNSYRDFQKDIWIHTCTVVSISIFFENQFPWGSLLTRFEILYLVIWCIHWIPLILHFLTTWRVFQLKKPRNWRENWYPRILTKPHFSVTCRYRRLVSFLEKKEFVIICCNCYIYCLC